MKKPLIKEPETVNSQNHAKSKEEQIGQTLASLYAEMTELFGVNFPFFSQVKVIPHREILNQLNRRVQDDFKKSGLIQSGGEWRQIGETLMQNQNAESFEHFAFYWPEEDTLYMNERMMTRYPEKVVSVCAHELAEKLLFSCTSSPTDSSFQSAARLYIEAGKTNSTKRIQQLLNEYVDTVFKTVFREGCCESIANETLHQSCFAAEAVALDKELRAGYPKCIGLLLSLENVIKNWERSEINQVGNKSLDQTNRNMGILKTAQIIKGVSYYIGYPLAKLILEKYGIRGLLEAIENHLPLKARYFVKPQAYLAILEKRLITAK
jgi:hypothetical protein